jgi:hypothetical protein
MRCVMEGGFFVVAAASGFFGALTGPAICALPADANTIVSITACHNANLDGLRKFPLLFR